MSNVTPYSQVRSAINTADVPLVRALLTQHFEALQEKGWVNDLFRHAARRDKVEVVALFAELGCDVNAPAADYAPEGVILDAAREGAVNVVRWLLAHGAKVNFQVEGVTTCLSLTGAACSGHLDVVKLLVEQGGADINATWSGDNALSYAIMYDQKKIEAYLRSKGALEPRQLEGKPGAGEPDAILAHIQEHLGKPNPLSLREIVATEPPIAIHVVTMADRLALITTGMSSHPMAVPPGGEDYLFAELVIYLPRDWPLTDQALQDAKYSWPIEWLRKIARFPLQNTTWLGGAAVVIANGEPPMPLAPNTQLTSLLALTEESDFGWLRLPDKRAIAFYTLYPLYTEERDLEKQQGTEYLLRLFQKHKISRIVDINRPNVAKLSGRLGRGSGRA